MLDTERRLLMDTAQSAYRDLLQQQKVRGLDERLVASPMSGTLASGHSLFDWPLSTQSVTGSPHVELGVTASAKIGEDRFRTKVGGMAFGLTSADQNGGIELTTVQPSMPFSSRGSADPAPNSRTMTPGQDSRTMTPGSSQGDKPDSSSDDNSRTMYPGGREDASNDSPTGEPDPECLKECQAGCSGYSPNLNKVFECYRACAFKCVGITVPGGTYDCGEMLVPPTDGQCYSEFKGNENDCSACRNYQSTEVVNTQAASWQGRNTWRFDVHSGVSDDEVGAMSAGLSLLQDNWDLCESTFCWFYGAPGSKADTIGGDILHGITLGLYNNYDTVKSCMARQLSGDVLPNEVRIYDLYSSTTSDPGRSIPDVGVYLHLGNANVQGWLNGYMSGASGNDRMFALIWIACWIFHELLHQCNVDLNDPPVFSEDDCNREAALMQNALAWALIQRYGRVITSTVASSGSYTDSSTGGFINFFGNIKWD